MSLFVGISFPSKQNQLLIINNNNRQDLIDYEEKIFSLLKNSFSKHYLIIWLKKHGIMLTKVALQTVVSNDKLPEKKCFS